MGSEGNPDFYTEVVQRLRACGTLHREMSILVVCGGPTDRTVLQQQSFTDVVISNVDRRASPHEFAPYRWRYEDVEQLSFPDESFDFVIVHSGLHHCHSPHRGLLEMYRVARQGLLLFEPYDNLITRLGVRLNIGQEYEHASVFYNGFAHGGVGNGPIPNLVFRWNQREVRKTIDCYAPHVRHDVDFIHRMRIPWGQVRARRSRRLYLVPRAAQPALKLIERCFPTQSNNFAAVIHKPRLPHGLHPWLRSSDRGVRLDEQWLAARYGRPPTPHHSRRS